MSQLELNGGASKKPIDIGSPGADKPPLVAALKRLVEGPVTTELGTSYTFAIEDANGWKRFSNASPVSATVPTFSQVAFPVGTSLTVEQSGAGQLSLVEGEDGGDMVAINSPVTLNLNAQYSVATLVKVGQDEWTIAGDLAAS